MPAQNAATETPTRSGAAGVLLPESNTVAPGPPAPAAGATGSASQTTTDEPEAQVASSDKEIESGLSSDSPDQQPQASPEKKDDEIAEDTEGDGGEILQKTTTNKSIAESMSLTREILFVGLITCAQLFTQAALAQLLATMHIIGDIIGITDPATLSWLIAGYSLTVGTFILFSGRLGDIYGYKLITLIGFGWFSLWSLVCGLSVYSSPVLFIFARVLQGIGPALCLPNGLALLGASYAPGQRKAIVFSIFAASAPNGAVLGSVFASLLTQFAWWPWIFWIFAIVLALCAVLGHYVIPDVHHTPLSDRPRGFRNIARELDLLGAFTGVLGLVLVNFAWNQAPVVGWNVPYVYVLFILGIIVIGVFFYIEAKAEKPLIPFHALNIDTSFVLGAIACGWGCFGIMVFYLWQIFLVGRGATPLLASAMFAPVSVMGICAAGVVGIMLHKIGPPIVMTCSLFAFITGVTLIATVPLEQSYWAQTFVATLIMPFGMDMSFPAATLILSDLLPKKHQGVGASLVNTVVNYSISLGLGFAGTVEVHVNNGGATFDDIIKGYRGALYMGIGLAGLGVVVCILYLIKSYGLKGKPATDPEKA